MTDSDSQGPQADQEDSINPSARLAQHLQKQPQDLIDARRLMRCFHVSPQDFTKVLAQMEQPTRLAQHLQKQPQDLIDARRLMRCFHVSPQDFTRVLAQMEHLEPSDD